MSEQAAEPPGAVTTIEGEGYPRFVHPYLGWEERLRRSAGYVSCAFTYEVLVPLALSETCPLQELVLAPFELLGTSRAMQAVVVRSAPPVLASIVCPGDILARVNEEVFPSMDRPATCASAMRALTSPRYPKALRLIRPAGLTLQPSPAEATILATAPHVTAKFEVGKNENGLQLNAKLVDSKAPLIVRRMLNGTKINWEPFASKPAPASVSAEESFRCGVYKERTKWVAVTRPKRPITVVEEGYERDRRCVFLGRFDSEADAVRACLKAEEETVTGRVLVAGRGGRVAPSLSTPAFAPPANTEPTATA